MDIAQFYNHNNFMDSVKQGDEIINNTDFNMYYNNRLQANTQFKIDDIIDDNGMLAKIVKIDNDTIIAKPLSWYSKNGKIKKAYINNGGLFFNPCHVTIVK